MDPQTTSEPSALSAIELKPAAEMATTPDLAASGTSSCRFRVQVRVNGSGTLPRSRAGAEACVREFGSRAMQAEALGCSVAHLSQVVVAPGVHAPRLRQGQRCAATAMQHLGLGSPPPPQAKLHPLPRRVCTPTNPRSAVYPSRP